MDFYLTTGSQRIHFPMNPEKITANTGARVLSFETIGLGEIALPKGTKIARISFEGFFPGEGRQALGILKSWQAPQFIVDQLQQWRNSGKKIRLLVTETPLNLDVYIDSFNHNYSGGHGDISYSLDLIQARTLTVYTENEMKNTGSKASPPRSSPEAPKTYTVRSGDSLYAIAKRTLGDGSRWREIYDTNKKTIGPDPNLIRPGQVLRIPGGTGAALG